MSHDRRQFLLLSASAGLGTGLAARTAAATPRTPAPFADYRPCEHPNGVTLPWKVVNGVKVGHLVAERVRHEFAPGLAANCWGYNGRVHGPLIEAVQGDRVRIYVTNKLDAPTTVHWHGVHLPNGMDGVGGLTQRSIEPGETFRYEFTLQRPGTFMYHSHHDEMVQMAMGLMGMIVVHPKQAEGPLPDRDFVYMLSEWALKVGTERPDPNEMTDFNVLTFNGKVFPATAPMVVKTGQRVRIRIGNLSAMDHHPIHLHGHSFAVIETDGGQIPESARWPETTVLVAPGQTRVVEFVADTPGDWAMHCHMTHHVMTQMGHGIPNLTGVDPSLFDEKLTEVLPGFAEMGKQHDPMGEDQTLPKNSLPMVGGQGGFGYVTMGGMVTVLKVRDNITNYDDPGFYVHPPGSVAAPAAREDLARDGIGS
ncbi:MAG TPA: copper oxidase [Planctomycetota bacterium]|nr:copper oxidase [Planctomycetota bacterium]